MNKKFEVIIPGKITQLRLGFSTYKCNETIMCEASSIDEVRKKYPNAIKIRQIDADEILLDINNENKKNI